jgi:hypothetical protein
MDKQKEKLKQMLEKERAANKGYEELAKLHCAYITILLHKLNATEDNAVTITKEEVTRAMSDFEARAFTDKDGGMSLYCVDYKKD